MKMTTIAGLISQKIYHVTCSTDAFRLLDDGEVILNFHVMLQKIAIIMPVGVTINVMRMYRDFAWNILNLHGIYMRVDSFLNTLFSILYSYGYEITSNAVCSEEVFDSDVYIEDDDEIGLFISLRGKMPDFDVYDRFTVTKN